MRTDIENRKDEVIQWVSEGKPIMEIGRLLNCSRDTVYNWLKKFGIDYKGNQGGKGRTWSSRRVPTLELIKSTTITNCKKRDRLIEDGYKEKQCECCGLSEWMGRPIPLELHHVDFNHYNNSLDNLQILCANCHAQAHNYCNNKVPVAQPAEACGLEPQ